MRTPTPGSDAALAAGCSCPRYDNARGRGRGTGPDGETVFVRRLDCPLHGITDPEAERRG